MKHSEPEEIIEPLPKRQGHLDRTWTTLAWGGPRARERERERERERDVGRHREKFPWGGRKCASSEAPTPPPRNPLKALSCWLDQMLRLMLLQFRISLGHSVAPVVQSDFEVTEQEFQKMGGQVHQDWKARPSLCPKQTRVLQIRTPCSVDISFVGLPEAYCQIIRHPNVVTHAELRNEAQSLGQILGER